MKKKSLILLFGLGIFAVGVGISFSVAGVLHAQAQALTVPTVSQAFNGTGGELYLSSSGPFTHDFRYKICFYDTMDSNGWGPTCATSPLASQVNSGGTWTDENDGRNAYSSTNTGDWSYWNWPGHSDEMGEITISIIDAGPLAAGTTLNNVQLGLELAEDNSGGLVETNTNLPIDNCIQVFTPIGGGWSPTAYSYTYGDNCDKGPSQTPDAFRAYFNSQVGKRTLSMTDNFPSSIVAGTPVPSPTISVKNGGDVITDPNWTIAVTGAGTGTCEIDTGGYGYNDSPNINLHPWKTGNATPPPSYTCTVPIAATAKDIYLTHTGAFTTPSPLNYVEAGTMVTSITPAYTFKTDNSNPAFNDKSANPFAFFIPTAFAIICPPSSCDGGGGPPPPPIIIHVPTSTYISYSPLLQISTNATAAFNIPNLTAPVTPNNYTETWTFHDQLGTFQGGTLTWPITVTPAASAPTVTLTANPTTVTLGQSTTLTITTTNATACTGSGSWIGSQPTSGTVSVTPSTTGTATYTITCTGPGPGSAKSSASVTVNAPSVLTGTVTVANENSVYPSIPVLAKWNIVDTGSATILPFPGYDGDICDESGITCEGYSQTYKNQPALDKGDASVSYGTVTMPRPSITLANTASSSLYAFNSIQVVPVASQEKIGTINAMLSLAKTIFGSTAEAFTIPPANPLSQTLLPAGTTNFIVLWNPIAGIAVSSSPLSVSSTAPSGASGQVQIVNTGAPGSTLKWTASSGSSWLSVTPSADATGLTNSASGKDASESVTINANPAGLPVGLNTGTITFTGASTPGTPLGPLTATLTVKYTVTAASKVTGVVVTCAPATIDTTKTSNCTAAVSGTGSYSNAVTWSVTNGFGTINASGVYTPPSTSGTAEVTATSIQDSVTSAPFAITVVLPTCMSSSCMPVCSPELTATPASIVVPESSNLSYNCSHVTSCTLSGGQFTPPQGVPVDLSTDIASGTASITPTSTTVYTLACQNQGYGNAFATSSVQVTVGGSNQCEQNPNGVGCPGQ